MIDMGMGEHQDVNAAAFAGAPAVQFKGLLAFALEESAVKHYAVAVDVNKMLRACHGFCCAMKSDFHFYSIMEGCWAGQPVDFYLKFPQ